MSTDRLNVNRIALCLSGGGYRAAAFHLGVLEYLDSVNLLQKVRILSTVSGGTLVGLAYAHALAREERFGLFRDRFRRFLLDTELVRLSLEKVGRPANTRSGYHTLITSVAEVYDEALFQGARFNVFWECPPLHLDDLIINATEFRTGIAFRFQKTARDAGAFGNGNVNISLADAKKIRLADIAAASSCFPGGFEPIAFPHDFQWPDGVIPESLLRAFESSLPLMDGGIYDNQGIDAAILSTDRSRQDQIDWFIISDTDRKNNNIYSYSVSRRFSTLTLDRINILALVLSGASALSCAALCVRLFLHLLDGGAWIGPGLLYGFPALVLASVSFVIFWLRKNIRDEVLQRIPAVRLASWDDLKRLTLDQVLHMAEVRITSLFAMAGSVFMKRIRALGYKLAYTKKGYEKKQISNLIYALTEVSPNLQKLLQPTPGMAAVARLASSMPTTLWFGSSKEQEYLHACGTYTTCFSLLAHLVNLHSRDAGTKPAAHTALWRRLKADWERFRQESAEFAGLEAE